MPKNAQGRDERNTGLHKNSATWIEKSMSSPKEEGSMPENDKDR